MIGVYYTKSPHAPPFASGTDGGGGTNQDDAIRRATQGDSGHQVVWASFELTTPDLKSNFLMSISSTVNGFAVFHPPRV